MTKRYDVPETIENVPPKKKQCQTGHKTRRTTWWRVECSANLGDPEFANLIAIECITEVCEVCNLAETKEGRALPPDSGDIEHYYDMHPGEKVPKKLLKPGRSGPVPQEEDEPPLEKGKILPGWSGRLFRGADGKDTRADFEPHYVIKTLMEALHRVTAEHSMAHLIVALTEATPRLDIEVPVDEGKRFVAAFFQKAAVVNNIWQRHLCEYWELGVGPEGQTFMPFRSTLHEWLSEWLSEDPKLTYPAASMTNPNRWTTDLDGKDIELADETASAAPKQEKEEVEETEEETKKAIPTPEKTKKVAPPPVKHKSRITTALGDRDTTGARREAEKVHGEDFVIAQIRPASKMKRVWVAERREHDIPKDGGVELFYAPPKRPEPDTAQAPAYALVSQKVGHISVINATDTGLEITVAIKDGEAFILIADPRR